MNTFQMLNIAWVQEECNAVPLIAVVTVKIREHITKPT